MPIYEYRCEACQHELEVIQKMSDALLVDCPACGKPTLSKQISAPVFRLKGAGWYETDFKSGDKKKNLADAATPSSAATGAATTSATTSTATSAASTTTTSSSSAT